MIEDILEKEMHPEFIDKVVRLYFEMSNTPVKNQAEKYFVENEIDLFKNSLDTNYIDCQVGAIRVLNGKYDSGKKIPFTEEARKLAKEIITF
jgi:hypothetical protein